MSRFDPFPKLTAFCFAVSLYTMMRPRKMLGYKKKVVYISCCVAKNILQRNMSYQFVGADGRNHPIKPDL